MKKLTAIVLVCMMFLAGCTTSTQYGECIGIQEDEVPTLKYKVSGLNIVLAVIFSETFFVPLVVLLADFKCPVEKR